MGKNTKQIPYFFAKELAVLCIFLVLSLLAFYFWARQGIAVWDFSYIVDPAYRISLGQIPYRDFWIIPFPVTFYIQAGLYRIFGTSLMVSLYYVACIDAVVAWCIYKILRRFLPNAFAFLLGAVNILWVGVPFGFPFYDIDAYFFIILALSLSLHTTTSAGFFAKFRYAIIGILVGLSILSKQNIGGAALLFLPALWVFIQETDRDKKSLKTKVTEFYGGVFFLGVMYLVFAFFQGYLFSQFTWAVQRATNSKGGVGDLPMQLIRNLFSSFTSMGVAHSAYIIAALTNTLPLVLAILLYIKIPKKNAYDKLALSLPVFVYIVILFQRLSISNAMFRYNGFFVGGSLGIIIYFVGRIFPSRRNIVAYALCVLYIVLGIVTNNRRLDNSWLGEKYNQSISEYTLQSRGIEGFQLAQDIGSGIDELIAYVNNNLHTPEDTFLVYPIDPFVHFSTGKIPVQPAIQFFPGKQFFAEDQEEYRQTYLPRIRWIFITKHLQEEQKFLDRFFIDLPLITKAIQSDYREVGTLQNYAIFRRIES